MSTPEGLPEPTTKGRAPRPETPKALEIPETSEGVRHSRLQQG
ncbi:hypothetical protein ACIO87_37200 [Streptomyces sp. NPDC087218]